MEEPAPEQRTTVEQAPARSGAGWLVAVVAVVGIAAAVVGVKRAESPSPSSSVAPLSNTITSEPEVPPGASRPAIGTLFQWEQDKQPGETTYAVDHLLLTLSARAIDLNPAPTLKVTGPQGETFEVVGDVGSSSASAELAVGRIDPASRQAQVIFNTFSGGAHCCQTIRLVEKLNGAWRTVTVAQLDGDTIGAFPSDLDGDGKVEFKLYDNAFLYAFASYAASWAPPKLLAVENGVAKDLSAEPRFRPIFAAYVDGPRRDCETNHNNGACAAYVAAAARLGQLEEAWPIMLSSYDKAAEWELPTACRDLGASGTCAPDETVTFATFPEALQWFLGDIAYAPPIYLASMVASGPSFSCATVKSDILKLVCATPELGKADRQLAELYGRALALSGDRPALRESQRQFINSRNNAPSDVFSLLRFYQARISELSEV